MPPRIQDKLAAIIAEIDRTGHAKTTRLNVLKKWFEHPGRLRAFGLWVAERAAARGDTATARPRSCSHFGTDLNGPSREKLVALLGFVATTEAREGESLD